MASESSSSGTRLDFRFAFCDDAQEIADLVCALRIMKASLCSSAFSVAKLQVNKVSSIEEDGDNNMNGDLVFRKSGVSRVLVDQVGYRMHDDNGKC